MGTTYTPAKADALQFAFSGLSFIDPGSAPYAAFDGDRIDSEFYLKPTQDELLALIWGSVADENYDQVYNAPAALAVGTPVYITTTDNTIAAADGSTAIKSKVFGFVRQYITSTTCTVSHFAYIGSGLVGFTTAGEQIFLDDAGAFSPTQGTYAVKLGRTLSANTAVISAQPAEGISGYSGYSGASGWSGIIGQSGWSGVSGQIGTSGWSGTPGSAVAQGDSGLSGFSGESNVSGWSGLSGYSGYSSAAPVVAAYTTARKTANEQRVTTSNASDADLHVALEANTTYEITAGLAWSGYYLYYGGYGTKTRWDYNTTYTDVALGDNCWTQNSFPSSEHQWIANNGTSFGEQIIKGLIRTDANPGTLTLYWASWNASQPITMFKDSFLCARKLDGAISGASGISGIMGSSGWSGFSGNDCYSGTSGVSGYSGAIGPTGTSGYSGYSSAVAGASGWSGLKGVSGYSGQDGSGLSGASGKRGYSGYSGEQGTSGYSGSDGASTSGWSGTSGQVGASGTSGQVGVSGWSGISDSGRSGWSGVAGAAGSIGSSGFSGAVGSQGLSGTSGQVGSSGFSGLIGLSGTSGVRGESGTYSGASGVSGMIGLSGTSGKSGASGVSGQAPVLYTVEQIILEGAGDVLVNGIKGYLNIGYDCEIVEAIAVSDATGDLEVEIWRQPYSGFPPLPTDNIVGAMDPIFINGARKWNSTALTGWTKTLNAGDWLGFYCVTASCISNATIALRLKRL